MLRYFSKWRIHIAEKWALLKQRGLAATISAVAIAFLVFHTFFPNVVFDTVSLALLVLAMLPWLGSTWIKSIEFAGWKLELRGIKEEVTATKEEVAATKLDLHRLGDKVSVGFETQTKRQDDVLSQVTKVESLVQILRRMHDFLAYLRTQGARFGPEPTVRIVEPTKLGESVRYDTKTNELVVTLGMVNEEDYILREGCFRVFHGELADGSIKAAVGEVAVSGPGFEVGSLIAGLGFYFVCSYKDTARFFGQGAQILDLQKPEASRWAPALSLRPSPDMEVEERVSFVTAVGDRWAHVLWGVRGRVGREEMDRTIIETWNELNKAEAFELRHDSFRAGLSRRLAAKDPAAAEALDNLAKGLLPPGPKP